MIQENCRIENVKGYKFYEHDISFDDYMFSNDIQLEHSSRSLANK